VQIDLVVGKSFSVSTETEPLEPFADVASHVRLIEPQDAAKLNAFGSSNPPALPDVSYVAFGS
jgi:hypothetical protein